MMNNSHIIHYIISVVSFYGILSYLTYGHYFQLILNSIFIIFLYTYTNQSFEGLFLYSYKSLNHVRLCLYGQYWVEGELFSKNSANPTSTLCFLMPFNLGALSSPLP